jgi:hypothetical protein
LFTRQPSQKRGALAASTARNNAEIAYTPTDSSWLGKIVTWQTPTLEPRGPLLQERRHAFRVVGTGGGLRVQRSHEVVLVPAVGDRSRWTVKPSTSTNVWVTGDFSECVVIDAPHNVDAILKVEADHVA